MFVEKSEQVDKVLPALVKAKGAIGKVAKGAKNPFFKSNYADLPAILDVVEPALQENGLALLQPIVSDTVVTTFIHESGQFVSIEGQSLVAAKQNDPQAMGSAITYARRYSLSSALSINADKDDDGEKAMNRGGGKPQATPNAKPTKYKVTENTVSKMIEACATEAGRKKVKESLPMYELSKEDLVKVTEALSK